MHGLVAAGLIWLLGATGNSAPDSSPPAPTAEQQIQVLKQQIETLKGQLEQQAAQVENGANRVTNLENLAEERARQASTLDSNQRLDLKDFAELFTQLATIYNIQVSGESFAANEIGQAAIAAQRLAQKSAAAQSWPQAGMLVDAAAYLSQAQKDASDHSMQLARIGVSDAMYLVTQALSAGPAVQTRTLPGSQ